MGLLQPLLLTPGEPAGIGPDLCLQWARQPERQPLVAVADSALLRDRARRLGLEVELFPWQPGEAAQCKAGVLSVWDLPGCGETTPGQLDPANSVYVLKTLERACDACLEGQAAGLVTAPVHKGVINEAGFAFSGHTEFLQARCGASQVVMMLATESLRVALVTTHLPLRDVSDAITADRLEAVIRTLHQGLQRDFGCPEPRIRVAGLNPHAGEGGHLGREETDVIEPVLERLRKQGLRLDGPLPADTLFTPHHLEGADAALAMYHDQGLPVLKYQGFGRAVNITLGLPIIRTSVDHGTALDLAGTGRADGGSLATAIALAANMAEHRREVG